MAPLPSILYKYCPPERKDILEDLRLKVTPPNEFNDPLELRPRMRRDFPIKDARKWVCDPEILALLYAQVRPHPPGLETYEKFVAWFRQHGKEQAAQEQVKNYPSAAQEFCQFNVDRISKDCGLICLSAVPDDILMWAHYTDSHRGFVIGFDTHDELFASPPVHAVEYLSKRVLMGHWADTRNGPRDALTRSVVRRKSPHWRYEQEWRQLRALSDCVHEPNPRKPEQILHFIPLPPKAIAEIILGYRCHSSEIDCLLKRSEFSDVTRRRACLHESEFKIVLEDGETF